MPTIRSLFASRTKWTVFCLSFFLAGCDPLNLASLFESEANGTSVLTLLETNDRELELWSEVEGALSASDYLSLNGNYLEAWSLDAKPGQTFSIDLMSDDFDSYLYVVGPGLTETLSDDDSGGACHARVTFTALERGTFHIVASSTGSRQAGTYRLRVSDSPVDRAGISCGGIDGYSLSSLGTNGRTLTRGQVGLGRLTGAEASIEHGRPVQAWSLHGVAGETVTIRLESDDYDSYLYFWGPGLAETLTDDDGGAGLDSQLTVTFAETGTYWVGAAALSSGSTGAYTLTLTEPVDLATLPTGERLLWTNTDAFGVLTESDPIAEGRPVQAWALEGRAGQRVTIDLMSDDFDSYLQVIGPGLHQTNDDGGEGLHSRLEITFPQDGTYRVVASSLGGDPGSYSLRVR